MSPWDFLAWAVAVGVSLIVVTLAIVVVIAAVKSLNGKRVTVSRKRRTVAPNV